MRFLGIDFGEKRIGLAVSDPTGTIATPFEVIKNDAQSISYIISLCEKQDIGKIIIGESIDFSGNPNPVQWKIQKFISALEGETSIEVISENETLTTKAATHIQGKHDKIDASAAALILNSFLERQKK
jgi:putative Holliday junction resolvase